MARSRIAVMGASCLLVLAATLSDAAAQTAGSPLPLLQIVHAKTAVHGRHKTAARIARAKPHERPVHRHLAKRVHAKTRIADAGRELPAPPATARQTTPPRATPQSDAQNIWPSPATAVGSSLAAPSGGSLPAGMASVGSAAAPAAAVVTESVVDSDPNGILNGGHTVPTALPAAVTPTAGAPAPQPAATPAPATTGSALKPQPATAQPAPTPSPAAKVAAAPAALKLPVHAMLFKPSAPSAVGSVPWIAQLLAALGGAIAAAAVAWFLIRPAPERNYG